jgi:hypothetical protein
MKLKWRFYWTMPEEVKEFLAQAQLPLLEPQFSVALYFPVVCCCIYLCKKLENCSKLGLTLKVTGILSTGYPVFELTEVF